MFRTIFQRAAALVVALVVLAACDADMAAPSADSMVRASALSDNASTVNRTSAIVPSSFVIFASCANAGQGEVLQVSGQVEFWGQWVTNPKGERVHHVLNANFAGSATGWDTGELYDVVTRESSQGTIAYGDDGIPDSGAEVQRLRLELTSHASGAVINIFLTARFVQAATGEFVVDVWDANTRCS